MTARDVVYGRQGGRVEKWKAPATGECRPTATVTCGCCRWLITARDVGRQCWVCGGDLAVVDGPEQPVEEMPPAGRAEQQEGLARARHALGAA